MRRRITSGWELELLQRQFDELFDLVTAGARPSPAGWAPAVDLLEFPDRFVIRLDLPGVEEGDLAIALAEQSLRIIGRKNPHREGGAERRYHRMERGFGPFEVELSLPQPVTPDGATATLRCGVLEVALPRRDRRSEPVHLIEVRTEEP